MLGPKAILLQISVIFACLSGDRQVPYRGKLTTVLGTPDVVPCLALNICYQVLIVFNRFLGAVIAYEPPCLTLVSQGSDPPVGCREVGVRVSAPLRRGAAPYGVAFRCF